MVYSSSMVYICVCCDDNCKNNDNCKNDDNCKKRNLDDNCKKVDNCKKKKFDDNCKKIQPTTTVKKTQRRQL